MRRFTQLQYILACGRAAAIILATLRQGPRRGLTEEQMLDQTILPGNVLADGLGLQRTKVQADVVTHFKAIPGNEFKDKL